MSAGTKIEWTDSTWNVVSGCTRVSPGCDHCYIAQTPPFRIGHRKFDAPGIGGTTGVLLHGDRMLQPFHWRKPRRIFVCSLADLFHADVPDRHIAKTWATMARTPQHTYQVLTKRPVRMRALLSSHDFELAVEAVCGHHDFVWPLPNVWCGVSAEDQKRADLRIPILLRTPAAVRWVSAEPLLGPLALHRWLPNGWGEGARWNPRPSFISNPAPTLDWVVAGGESGPGARPMHPRWARSLRDQCAANGAAYLFKQWGEWAPAEWKGEGGATHAFTGGYYREGGRDVEGFMELGHSPTSLERDEKTPAGAQGMRRVGKKAAGRLLDGATHDGYPEVAR